MGEVRGARPVNAACFAALRRVADHGKTADEILTGPLPEKFKDYGMGRAKADVAALYNGLKQ